MFSFKKARVNTRSRGDIAEALGQHYLEKKGLTLVTKNYHCRQGEIDLIMQHQNTLVFIEVRYRQKTDFGQAFETINYSKQQKIIKAAKHYLHQNKLTESVTSRFDALGIKPINAQKELQTGQFNDFQFDWIQNAFY